MSNKKYDLDKLISVELIPEEVCTNIEWREEKKETIWLFFIPIKETRPAGWYLVDNSVEEYFGEQFNSKEIFIDKDRIIEKSSLVYTFADGSQERVYYKDETEARTKFEFFDSKFTTLW